MAIPPIEFKRINEEVANGLRYRYPVKNANTPFPFPVVVMQSGSQKPDVIYYMSLNELRNYSFLAPQEKPSGSGIDVLFDEGSESETASVARYEMNALPNGNQEFHVVATHDSDERGQYTFASWYEATPTGIVPKYYAWTRDFNTTFNIIVPECLAYTMLWLVGLITWKIVSSRRRRLETPAEKPIDQ